MPSFNKAPFELICQFTVLPFNSDSLIHKSGGLKPSSDVMSHVKVECKNCNTLEDCFIITEVNFEPHIN